MPIEDDKKNNQKTMSTQLEQSLIQYYSKPHRHSFSIVKKGDNWFLGGFKRFAFPLIMDVLSIVGDTVVDVISNKVPLKRAILDNISKAIAKRRRKGSTRDMFTKSSQ